MRQRGSGRVHKLIEFQSYVPTLKRSTDYIHFCHFSVLSVFFCLSACREFEYRRNRLRAWRTSWSPSNSELLYALVEWMWSPYIGRIICIPYIYIYSDVGIYLCCLWICWLDLMSYYAFEIDEFVLSIKYIYMQNGNNKMVCIFLEKCKHCWLIPSAQQWNVYWCNEHSNRQLIEVLQMLCDEEQIRQYTWTWIGDRRRHAKHIIK